MRSSKEELREELEKLHKEWDLLDKELLALEAKSDKTGDDRRRIYAITSEQAELKAEGKRKSDRIMPSVERRNKQRRLFFGAMAVLVIGLITVITILDNNSSPGAGDTLGARTAARMFVRDRLKSPGSAKFGTISATSLGSNRYSFSGYVDAQNSFGAEIRTHFSGIVRLHENKTWILESLSL